MVGKKGAGLGGWDLGLFDSLGVLVEGVDRWIYAPAHSLGERGKRRSG
jgi:hypothetical protein